MPSIWTENLAPPRYASSALEASRASAEEAEEIAGAIFCPGSNLELDAEREQGPQPFDYDSRQPPPSVPKKGRVAVAGGPPRLRQRRGIKKWPSA